MIIYILLERKCAREDVSAGGNVIKPMSDTIFNVAAYACVLSDKFSLLEDIENKYEYNRKSMGEIAWHFDV